MARTALGVGFLLAGFLWAGPIVGEMSAAERCADAGGSYDYTRAQCDFKAIHPDPPLWQRHGIDLVGAFACSLFGFVLLLRRRPVVRTNLAQGSSFDNGGKP